MMLENEKIAQESDEIQETQNGEPSDVQYQTLQDLCENNINYFVNDNTPNGQRLHQSFVAIKEAVENVRPIIIDLYNISLKYNFEENYPANGYYSYILMVEGTISHLVQFHRKVCLKRHNILFRKSSYAKEMESYVSLLKNLVTFGEGLKLLRLAEKDGCLILDNLPEDLIAKSKEIDQHTFYGRNLGFQFCESVRPMLRFVMLSMAIFSEAFYSHGSMFSKAKNSVTTTAKYILDPEERSKRVIKIFQYAPVDFCKSFWFLSESELMKQMPLVIGHSVAVSKLIQIPPQPLVLNTGDGDISVPVPYSYIGKRPVQVRLISFEAREGMIGEVGTKNKLHPASRGLMIHCHGGGFAAQSSQSHECYLREWAKQLNIPILSVDYSLAPEAPYPRALEEVVFAYTWALQNAHLLGTTAERVVFVGDSAGGNLLLGLTLKCLALNLPLPQGIVPIYAPTWLSSFGLSPSRFMLLMDPLIPIGFATRLIKAYLVPAISKDPPKSDSDTESFEEVSQSDLVELQAHKSPVSDASESITCGSLSSPTAETKDTIKPVDISEIDFVSESTTQTVNPSDFLERYVLDSDTDTDGNRIAVLKQETTTQQYEHSMHQRLASVVSNLRHRFGSWVSTKQNGEEIFLDTSKPYDILEECSHKFNTDAFASPYHATNDMLSRFPLVKLVTTHLDPFLDDNVIFANKLKKLNKDVTLDVLPGLPHGFLNFSMVSKEAEQGSKLCIQRIKEILDLDNLPPLQTSS
uniref:Hormone-sensitive lipase n=1 Tax=Photinus pyralis TaxID=7054 RepID=A0A1Y1LC87_PHOPY